MIKQQFLVGVTITEKVPGHILSIMSKSDTVHLVTFFNP